MSEEVKTAKPDKVVKLLAEQEIKDSMADAKFYELLPEFLPLRMKMKAAHDDLITPHGCTACAKNRAYRSMGPDYLRIVEHLTEDGVLRLRTYFGADELRANVIDAVTKQPKTLKL